MSLFGKEPTGMLAAADGVNLSVELPLRLYIESSHVSEISFEIRVTNAAVSYKSQKHAKFGFCDISRITARLVGKKVPA